MQHLVFSETPTVFYLNRSTPREFNLLPETGTPGSLKIHAVASPDPAIDHRRNHAAG